MSASWRTVSISHGSRPICGTKQAQPSRQPPKKGVRHRQGRKRVTPLSSNGRATRPWRVVRRTRRGEPQLGRPTTAKRSPGRIWSNPAKPHPRTFLRSRRRSRLSPPRRQPPPPRYRRMPPPQARGMSGRPPRAPPNRNRAATAPRNTGRVWNGPEACRPNLVGKSCSSRCPPVTTALPPTASRVSHPPFPPRHDPSRAGRPSPPN